MGWSSTLFGAGTGMAIGGPIGAIVGAAVGYGLGKIGDDTEYEDEQERIQAIFFSTVFATMGYVAKADGRISEEEVSLATDLMDEVELDSEQREFAKNLFREGKSPDFPLDDVLQQFRSECSDDPETRNFFIWILFHVAYADGLLDPRERHVLQDIASKVGIDRSKLDEIEAEVRAESHEDSGAVDLEDAYKELGIPPAASDDEVRRAYLNRVKDFHPDKLESKGLPEEMKRFAEERCKAFSAAYERIKQARHL